MELKLNKLLNCNPWLTKHVEWMENWKDIIEEENWTSKVGLVPLF
jgi:hypothetical protein